MLSLVIAGRRKISRFLYLSVMSVYVVLLAGVELMCDDLDGITVLLKKASYPATYDRLRFVNSNCYAIDYKNNFLKISTSFDNCSTTMTVSWTQLCETIFARTDLTSGHPLCFVEGHNASTTMDHRLYHELYEHCVNSSSLFFRIRLQKYLVWEGSTHF